MIAKLLETAIRNCISFHRKAVDSKTFHVFLLPLPNGKLLKIAPVSDTE
jgi:hypothetical protein